MPKYRWYYEIGWAVEFVRKDAEIQYSLDDRLIHGQKVISRGHKTVEEAQAAAIKACEILDKKIKDFILKELSTLKDAQE